MLNGQKVWTSGAQYADFGYILCRTDPDVPKHRGLTAFLIDMRRPRGRGAPAAPDDAVGRQFNEVFLDRRARAATACASATSAAAGAWPSPPSASSAAGAGGVSADHGRPAAWRPPQHLGRADDPVVRQGLARAVTHQRLMGWNKQRVLARQRAGETPGPEGSIGKLFWTEGLRLHERRGRHHPRPAARWPTPASGAPTPGPSTSWAPPGSGWPPAPTRCSATSSASASSACRPRSGWTGTCRSGTSHVTQLRS